MRLIFKQSKQWDNLIFVTITQLHDKWQVLHCQNGPTCYAASISLWFIDGVSNCYWMSQPSNFRMKAVWWEKNNLIGNDLSKHAWMNSESESSVKSTWTIWEVKRARSMGDNVKGLAVRVMLSWYWSGVGPDPIDSNVFESSSLQATLQGRKWTVVALRVSNFPKSQQDFLPLWNLPLSM